MVAAKVLELTEARRSLRATVVSAFSQDQNGSLSQMQRGWDGATTEKPPPTGGSTHPIPYSYHGTCRNKVTPTLALSQLIGISLHRAKSCHWLVLLGNIEFELELLLAVVGVLVDGVTDWLI